MSLHILTTDDQMVQQLTHLLAGGAQPFSFYSDLEALIAVLPKLKKVDLVFYDLQLEATLWAFDAIHFGAKKTNLVGFEPIAEGSAEGTHRCPANAQYYLVVSKDARRTKVRLQQILHEVDEKNAKKQAKRKKAARKRSADTDAAHVAWEQSKYRNDADSPVTITRYLRTRSAVMQQFVARICEVANQAPIVLIESEDGAEFELVARELNFRANGDENSLFVLDPMNIDHDLLAKIAGATEGTVCYCYIGLSYELSAQSIEQLNHFFEVILEAGENTTLRLILGHVADSESYVSEGAMQLVKDFRRSGALLELPGMDERKEDVHVIAQSVFTTLRVAHPFLCTRTLSSGAIHHLESIHKSLDYSSLVRVIRNAMALTERDTLTEEELKNFSDDSLTSQHLIESLADEKFFKEHDGVA